MSDIEETAPENSLIDLSDNEIEIEIEKVRDFPEDGVFFKVFYRNLASLLFCCKINTPNLLKMVKI